MLLRSVHLLNPMDTARLLPWTSPEGKPCFLLGGEGTGYVSRLADRVEAAQMSSAAGLIEEAGRILDGRSWTPGEIHLLAVELNDSLMKVRRVAESRGARLLLLADNPTEDDGTDTDTDRDGADDGPGADRGLDVDGADGVEHGAAQGAPAR
ncbi:hypothetical protein GZL_03808 [Streptomyces sp. 769]|nr:hypothetical protein GZL_03808 [Streptomyces sp. 769]